MRSSIPAIFGHLLAEETLRSRYNRFVNEEKRRNLRSLSRDTQRLSPSGRGVGVSDDDDDDDRRDGSEAEEVVDGEGRADGPGEVMVAGLGAGFQASPSSDNGSNNGSTG